MLKFLLTAVTIRTNTYLAEAGCQLLQLIGAAWMEVVRSQLSV